MSTFKRERFCAAVAEGHTFTDAAKLAGYSARSAYSLGSSLARRPEIQARIQELRDRAGSVTLSELPGSSVQIRRIVDQAGRTLGIFIPIDAVSAHMKE